MRLPSENPYGNKKYLPLINNYLNLHCILYSKQLGAFPERVMSIIDQFSPRKVQGAAHYNSCDK